MKTVELLEEEIERLEAELSDAKYSMNSALAIAHKAKTECADKLSTRAHFASMAMAATMSIKSINMSNMRGFPNHKDVAKLSIAAADSLIEALDE